MGKWCNLPLELVDIIDDNVALYRDKVRLRAVSLEWNSNLPKMPDHRAKQIHFLLHPLEHNEDETHGLFNPLDKNIYKLYVPELSGKVFRGSFYGWIVATEEIDRGIYEIYLINPITRAQIKLPPRREFSDGGFFYHERVDGKRVSRISRTISSDYEFDDFSEKFMLNKYHMKIVLSSDPSNDECVVVATFGLGDIAWCKCDGKKWARVDTAESTHFFDILYSKNYLYALTEEGRVFMFENIETELEIKYIEITSVPIPSECCAYLAECSDGSLIVAARYIVYDTNQGQNFISTKEFKVYKLLPNPNSSWAEVKSIGDDVLFVNFGSVRSLSSKNLEGFKKNHIYFCDFSRLATDEDNKNVKPNVCVFNLEDGIVKPLQGLGDFIWPRPIWTNIA